VASSTKPRWSVGLSVTVVFGALIALGTFFSIPLPQPLYEITWAPAIYLALSAMVDIPTSASAIAIGSFIGEAVNVSVKGGSPIYPLGIVWARVPEALIVGWARNRGTKTLAGAMVIATVFETLAFFFPDWLFYTYGFFQYGTPTTAASALGLAAFDFGTLADVAFIPVAFGIIKAARPAFRRLGFV
jgi:hypothetical protein